MNHDGEPPAQLDAHHAPRRFQRFDNLSAKVVTTPRSDDRQQKGQPLASQVTCECWYIIRCGCLRPSCQEHKEHASGARTAAALAIHRFLEGSAIALAGRRRSR